MNAEASRAFMLPDFFSKTLPHRTILNTNTLLNTDADPPEIQAKIQSRGRITPNPRYLAVLRLDIKLNILASTVKINPRCIPETAIMCDTPVSVNCS